MTSRRAKHGKKKGALIKAAFFLYFAFSLFATVWLRTAVVNLEYEIGDLDRLRADLFNDREMVVAQRSSFYSMGNVEKVAFKRLGMKYVDRANVFYVKRTESAVPRRTSSRNRYSD